MSQAELPLTSHEKRLETIRSRYGPGFFAKVGKLGGLTTSVRHQTEWYQQLGKRGGTTTAERHGREHFVAAGKLGGAASAKKGSRWLNKRAHAGSLGRWPIEWGALAEQPDDQRTPQPPSDELNLVEAQP